MSPEELAVIARTIADENKVDEDLVCAIIEVESAWSIYAFRYEPYWKYFTEIAKHACNTGITEMSERVLQASSIGLMQVMGSVARELQFKGNLLMLCDPEVGVHYGCLKLRALFAKHKTTADVVSAYNQGFPVKVGANYKNQAYVNKVMAIYNGKAKNHH